ncbi:hypothetical protein [Nitratidesulfovibrio sp. SRB-5]|uniref:hypothetical protein n=1 Tax=Nitratidesulfovibrio sp. SRB-5 TaxID=2872636 RepID=UPI001026717A|nr:hypothetical protein [Nitratidesulfovibrio sp. SRB-5]MBZ2172653.1 hypothetical protein [Nitratidesulfovibrio sp. SRB-5]RXF76526.1 hypothetical protein EKK70_11365 [Desulfovibrio sp. DS-1]
MLPATVRTGTCVALLLAGMALAAVTARAVGQLHSPLRSDSGHEWGHDWGHDRGQPPPPPPPLPGMGFPPAPPSAFPTGASHGAPPPPTAEQRSIIRNIRAAFAARFAALHQEHYAAWVALEASLTRAAPNPDETARNAAALRDVTAKQQDLAIEMRQRIIRETGIRTPLPGHLPPPPSGMAKFTAPPPA